MTKNFIFVGLLLICASVASLGHAAGSRFETIGRTVSSENFTCTHNGQTFAVSIEAREIQTCIMIIEDLATDKQKCQAFTSVGNRLYLVAKNAEGKTIADTPIRIFDSDQVYMGIHRDVSISAGTMSVLIFDRNKLKLAVGDFFGTDEKIFLGGLGQRTYTCRAVN